MLELNLVKLRRPLMSFLRSVVEWLYSIDFPLRLLESNNSTPMLGIATRQKAAEEDCRNCLVLRNWILLIYLYIISEPGLSIWVRPQELKFFKALHHISHASTHNPKHKNTSSATRGSALSLTLYLEKSMKESSRGLHRSNSNKRNIWYCQNKYKFRL